MARPSHRKRTKAHSPATRRERLALLAGGSLVIVVAAGIGIVLAVHTTGAQRPVSHEETATTSPPAPLVVANVSPAAGATKVAYDARIRLTFSEPVAASSAEPTLSPAIAGTWAIKGKDSLVFTPKAPMLPSSTETVTVPAGFSAADGSTLAKAYSTHFTVAAGSILRLQQLLAELDYLPVGFVPDGAGPSATRLEDALANEPTNPASISLEPEPGSFAWRFAHIPRQLAATWTPGVWNVATEGAIMGFESEHGLAIDGDAGPLVWKALLQAVASHEATTRPYDYLIASETVPETLYVWSNGKLVYQTPTNSGVAGATTEQGTWPVYLRYEVTTMSGTNPDGTHYTDPGIPWVSYFNGSDAVHGFERAEYGFPQSDGCLEVPIANAEVIYPLDPYGTLVTVTTGDLSPELGGTPPEIIGVPPAPVTTTPTKPGTKKPVTTSTKAPVSHPTSTTEAPTTTEPATTTSLAPATTTLAPTTSAPTSTS